MNINRKPVVNLDDYQFSAIRTAVYPGIGGAVGLLYTSPASVTRQERCWAR